MSGSREKKSKCSRRAGKGLGSAARLGAGETRAMAGIDRDRQGRAGIRGMSSSVGLEPERPSSRVWATWSVTAASLRFWSAWATWSTLGREQASRTPATVQLGGLKRLPVDGCFLFSLSPDVC